MPLTKFLGLIPARYASTRFPGKPLADIAGKPMIQRVYEQVAGSLDAVVVATDDERIFQAVQNFGGKAVMTSPNHRSGTDRCYEALTKTAGNFNVVINIQGDEPFIKPSQIELLKTCFECDETQIATLVKPFPEDVGFDVLFNPNTPKVLLNTKQEAIYFSRSVIPYIRGKHHSRWLKSFTFYKHIGIYAYKSGVLGEITALPQSPLELAESLEQLRWIENGYTIKAAITNEETFGIDTPEDLERWLRAGDLKKNYKTLPPPSPPAPTKKASQTPHLPKKVQFRQ
ncbi:MAG: 3-deoxy-manno-octulosonate cytidylyltransferase [Dysgonamonadaceae bacterium]|jgi:3-deoxy-manno-octulosonate cytidylyltransferase (CMP-KDO synthetase)|nr:3-deoxy-manno-octulosonate cytidylyltransferase [Dysgonamonadaceae bacterium]